MKEQEKTSHTKLNAMEISSMPDKEFNVMIIKIFTKLERRGEDRSENFDKGIQYINRPGVEEYITEMKNTLDGINSRLMEGEEWFSNLEDKEMESTLAAH